MQFQDAHKLKSLWYVLIVLLLKVDAYIKYRTKKLLFSVS